MNSLCTNHKFVFSDGNFNLYIINCKVFLENKEGVLLGLNSINPALHARTSNSNHIFNAITRSLNPSVILSVLKKKTFSLKWKQIA